MEKNKNSELVFTTYVTLKNGRKLYARQFGKKVFCFPKSKKVKNVD